LLPGWRRCCRWTSAWLARIDAVIGELQPTAQRHAEILVKARKISGRLKRELTSG
jgi:hypothetical protein